MRVLYSFILLCLSGCASLPEGFTGPELPPDPTVAPAERNSYDQRDPNEIAVDLLKYQKKF